MVAHIDIRKAGGVIIKDRKFLVVRSYGKDVFVGPGGKLEGDENPRQALTRELREELQLDTTEDDFEELGTFYAPAAGNESKMLEMVVFLVAGITTEPVPSAEIEELWWISTADHDVPLGSIFEHDVMPMLKQKGLID